MRPRYKIGLGLVLVSRAGLPRVLEYSLGYSTEYTTPKLLVSEGLVSVSVSVSRPIVSARSQGKNVGVSTSIWGRSFGLGRSRDRNTGLSTSTLISKVRLGFGLGNFVSVTAHIIVFSRRRENPRVAPAPLCMRADGLRASHHRKLVSAAACGRLVRRL